MHSAAIGTKEVARSGLGKRGWNRAHARSNFEFHPYCKFGGVNDDSPWHGRIAPNGEIHEKDRFACCRNCSCCVARACSEKEENDQGRGRSRENRARQRQYPPRSERFV